MERQVNRPKEEQSPVDPCREVQVPTYVQDTGQHLRAQRGQSSCTATSRAAELLIEHIIRKTGLGSDERVKIGRRHFNNLRYMNDTILLAESSNDSKQLMNMKEESAKEGLQLNIRKTKIMTTEELQNFTVSNEEIEIEPCQTCRMGAFTLHSKTGKPMPSVSNGGIPGKKCGTIILSAEELGNCREKLIESSLSPFYPHDNNPVRKVQLPVTGPRSPMLFPLRLSESPGNHYQAIVTPRLVVGNTKRKGLAQKCPVRQAEPLEWGLDNLVALTLLCSALEAAFLLFTQFQWPPQKDYMLACTWDNFSHGFSHCMPHLRNICMKAFLNVNSVNSAAQLTDNNMFSASNSKDVATMQFCANKLDKKDFFGKSDPFMVFYRSNEDGTFTICHKTEVVKNTLNPVWQSFTIPVRALCNGDYDRHAALESFSEIELVPRLERVLDPFAKPLFSHFKEKIPQIRQELDSTVDRTPEREVSKALSGPSLLDEFQLLWPEEVNMMLGLMIAIGSIFLALVAMETYDTGTKLVTDRDNKRNLLLIRFPDGKTIKVEVYDWDRDGSHDFIGEFTTSYRELARGQSQFNVYELESGLSQLDLIILCPAIWHQQEEILTFLFVTAFEVFISEILTFGNIHAKNSPINCRAFCFQVALGVGVRDDRHQLGDFTFFLQAEDWAPQADGKAHVELKNKSLQQHDIHITLLPYLGFLLLPNIFHAACVRHGSNLISSKVTVLGLFLKSPTRLKHSWIPASPLTELCFFFPPPR
ncbi:Copine-5 [Varanus komodoensis]|nr:Copine-5 [Varanus komodoensis]